ncbi:uncharacterized small protein (DUF1192 family) [Microbacterium endophyticum]|uniref:Uncharacterized small protein (DUF1192 family) n=1 Tax=Microbacterium endophyticum TaxID=1526412 RepID=A0A7W4YMY6_9MICO|nr:PLD nuclease N-terminal domain-containing protein [Microbacterium endophyticum]MBB2976673.1 uncharacterized small protein (DUF1192 family) [Microbacterium endophyticum]NIK37634.1 uncharacterized small protein (DUF1192 family) [Microbacterium endophyticum]
MARLLLILALVVTVFWVYSVVDCAVQPADRHRGVRKGTWLAIVILIPVLGGLLWFVVGRVSRRALIAERNAPDDDPAFLSSLGSVSDQDERIRRLEEELARLDDEDTSLLDGKSVDDAPSGSAPRADAPVDEAETGPRGDGDDDTHGSRGARG